MIQIFDDIKNYHEFFSFKWCWCCEKHFNPLLVGCVPYGTQGKEALIACSHESWPNVQCNVNLRYVIKFVWIARICQFHCLYSPIFNHLDSSPLTHLPLTQHFKPLMLGHIDNINRFRRCAIWHAPDNSEFSIYSVNSGLNVLMLVVFQKQLKSNSSLECLNKGWKHNW